VKRFELGDKFWEISVTGATITTRTGKLGAAGHTKLKKLATAAAAAGEGETMIAAKRAQGFAPAGKTSPARRPPKSEPATASAGNPALEKEIERDPDDDDRLAVYADWLQQQGDPRGELAAVQRALPLATGARRKQLQAAEKALLKKHGDALLGPLGPLIASAAASYRHQRYRIRGMGPTWRSGFLDAIRITAWPEMDDCLADIDDRYERWPILRELLPDEDDPFEINHLLALVLRDPSARFLRELGLGHTTTDDGPLYDAGKPSLLDVLCTFEIPTLRRLEIGALDFAMGETEYSWTALGNVGKVLRRFRRLREVRLAGAGQHHDAHSYKQKPNPLRLELGHIDLPELGWFELRTPDLRVSQLDSIVTARWPKLQSLEVWFGATDRGSDCTVDDARKLIDKAPALRVLGLQNAEFVDDLIEPLARSRVVRHLEVLDLSRGCLTDVGAQRLRDHADAFGLLQRLVLDRSYLSPVGKRLVKGICADVSVAGQREAEGEDRFVDVAE